MLRCLASQTTDQMFSRLSLPALARPVSMSCISCAKSTVVLGLERNLHSLTGFTETLMDMGCQAHRNEQGRQTIFLIRDYLGADIYIGFGGRGRAACKCQGRASAGEIGYLSICSVSPLSDHGPVLILSCHPAIRDVIFSGAKLKRSTLYCNQQKMIGLHPIEHVETKGKHYRGYHERLCAERFSGLYHIGQVEPTVNTIAFLPLRLLSGKNFGMASYSRENFYIEKTVRL